MALSGSVTTTEYKGRSVTFNWTANQDITNNTSTISWNLTGSGSYTSGYVLVNELRVTIDGSEAYYRNQDNHTECYNGTTLASGTKTITHNSNGSRSFAVKVEAGIYNWAINCSGTDTFTLTQIPRQANIISAPDFSDEDNPLIKYSNPAGNNVSELSACISLAGEKDDIKYRNIPKTGSSYIFTLSDAERNVLRNACTTANSRTVIFFVRTVIGGVTYYSTLQKTLTIVNANPIVTGTVQDTNTTTTALTGNSSKLVKYYSTATTTINAGAVKGASLTSQKTTHGGKSIATVTGTFEAVENNNFVFSATDSRGNTTTKTVTPTMVDYIKLTCNLSYTNPTTSGSMTVKLTGNYFNSSFGSVSNTLSAYYRYKESGGSWSAWKSITATKSNNTYTASGSITGLDYQKTYVIQAKAVDKLRTVTTGEISVKSLPVFDWSKSDFNFNVPVTVLAPTANFNPATKKYVDNKISKVNKSINALPKVQYGTFSMPFGPNGTTKSVTFASAFKTTPVVIVSQPFNSANVVVLKANVTTTGFKVGLDMGSTSASGNRDVMYIAVGT